MFRLGAASNSEHTSNSQQQPESISVHPDHQVTTLKLPDLKNCSTMQERQLVSSEES